MEQAEHPREPRPARSPVVARHAAPLDVLFNEPHRFGFFQAVRLLELKWAQTAGPAPLLGDRIRFRNSLSLAFPPSEIESLTVHRTDDALGVDRVSHVEFTPAFMGLLGSQGALPVSYTESLSQMESLRKDSGPRAFMDLFANRAVSLFHQAWKKHRLALRHEVDPRQQFLPMALALAGVGQKGLRDRFDAGQDGLTDSALAYYAGTLQQRTLSAHQMQHVLGDYLGVPVRVEQFVGRWYTVPEAGRTMLGLESGGGVLGQSAMLGERVWQRDLRLRVVLGPLGREGYERFLPGAPGARALASMVTMCQGVSLEYEVRLKLAKEAVQGCALDDRRSPLQGRLGWDTFLLSGPASADREDVSYDIHAAA